MKPTFTLLLCALCLTAGYVVGMVDANRRTLARALNVIDTIKLPVGNLNAQDAIAIVAESATPRWRKKHALGEEYERNCWVNITPDWEKR